MVLELIPKGVPLSRLHAHAEVQHVLSAFTCPAHPASLESRVDDALARGFDDTASDRDPASSELGVAHAFAVSAKVANDTLDKLAALGAIAEAVAVASQGPEQTLEAVRVLEQERAVLGMPTTRGPLLLAEDCLGCQREMLGRMEEVEDLSCAEVQQITLEIVPKRQLAVAQDHHLAKGAFLPECEHGLTHLVEECRHPRLWHSSEVLRGDSLRKFLGPVAWLVDGHGPDSSLLPCRWGTVAFTHTWTLGWATRLAARLSQGNRHSVRADDQELTIGQWILTRDSVFDVFPRFVGPLAELGDGAPDGLLRRRLRQDFRKEGASEGGAEVRGGERDRFFNVRSHEPADHAAVQVDRRDAVATCVALEVPSIDMDDPERGQPLLRGDLLEAVPLGKVLEDVFDLVLEADEFGERFPACAGEHRLEPVDELREQPRIELVPSCRFDEVGQLLSEVGYNTGHDLSYAHGEAFLSLGVSAFERVTCTQYGGASPPFTRSQETTSERTYTPIYDVDLTYDRNSNITVLDEHVHDGFDVQFTIDDLDRVTSATEGTWSGSAITSKTRAQDWTLNQVGDWDHTRLDLNGDADYTDADEHDDDRTYNEVNELEARDVDNDSSDDFTLTYDEAGNLTDDGEEYKYEYDAFYRLRRILNQSDELVLENVYNGLGHRISSHADTDDDGDVDGSDDWEHHAFDERWREVAMFVNDDTAPTEEFVNHAAGTGFGDASYIDELILRDRDTDGNGSLEERIFYCQNWRHDVVALVDDASEQVEMVRYSAYGVPFGLPAGDVDSDGDCEGASEIQGLGSYDVRGDLDLDGDVDSVDEGLATVQTGGRGVLSLAGSKHGHSGVNHTHGATVDRRRWRDLDLGEWLLRDSGGLCSSPAVRLDTAVQQ